jgi:hypothetical protein
VAIAAAVAFLYFTAARPASPLPMGAAIPPFDLPALGHEGRVRDTDLRGHPVALGFLDTRWPDFLDAVEGLERLNRALRRRGLVVMGVFVEEDPEAAREFVRTQPVTFTTVHDPGARAIAGAARPPSAPEIVVLVGGRAVSRSTDVAAWRQAPFRSTFDPYLEPEKPGL